MQVYTLPDITPNGSATPLAAAGSTLQAIWINATASGTSIRFGDANVGSNRGQALPTGVPSVVAVRCDPEQRPYLLSECYVYGGSGSDKVSITYGV
jgi:hypothetical protein